MEPCSPPPPAPPLQNGDRLTRAEFERSYAAHPEIHRAELIDGRVYVASPVRTDQHGLPHTHLFGWMHVYAVATPGVTPLSNVTLRLDGDNEPQPDLMLRLDEGRGGSSRIDQDGYVAGPPELVAEIAASSRSYDLHEKLHTYRRNGVAEYLVWRTVDGELDWFQLRDDRYVPIPADPDGTLRSRVFPGLWLDPAALLAGHDHRVLDRLHEGLATPEHAAFARRCKPS
ncbi:MAG: Uma2 family endonuclease [Planctomycetes bacterium]|nr:Uma2 family endonuclease [Planctomycetota bacterium]